MNTSLFPLINDNPRYPAPFITSGLFRYLSAGVSKRPTYYRDGYHLPVYPRVFEIGREIFDKEIAVKPSSKTALMLAVEIGDRFGENNTEDSKDFQAFNSSPGVKTDESLV